MNEEYVKRLLNLYRDDLLSRAEWAELCVVIREGQHDHLIEEDLQDIANRPEADEAWTEPGKQRVLAQILAGIHGEGRKPMTLIAPRMRRIYRMVAVAAACVLPVIAIWLYRHSRVPSPATAIKAVPLVPGGQKAVLMLGDGTKITLDSAGEGTLAQQGGVQVVQQGNGTIAYHLGEHTGDEVMYNTVVTPRGGEYQLILPDGSHVWLNSASSIRYPNVFMGNERNVEITGEVYLSVAPNSKMPFLVSARGIQVSVLGTEFDLMSYEDEGAIRATLVNGSVKVAKGRASQLLTPGKQAVLAPADDQITVETPDMSQVLAWKEGRFRFDGIKIQALMRQIARWYDVDVVYQGAVPENEFNGSIKRKEDASRILEALELTGNVHFNIEGRKITVIPGPR